jgi:hypothetical protein
MLADPVTVAASSPVPSLVFSITKSDGYGSERVDVGGNGYAILIQHQPGGKGDRHYVKLSRTKDATNPYSGLTSKQSASVSLSIAGAPFGFTSTEMSELVRSLLEFVNDTEVTTARLLQNQS